MKKIVSLLLAAMLTICLAVTVMAAPSVGSGPKVVYVTIDGTPIASEDLGNYINPIPAQPGSLGAFEVTLNNADSITVQIYVPGANPGDTIIVMFPNGAMYEIIVGEDGTITIEITEETTFEVILKNSELPETPDKPEQKPVEGGEGTSPKTGETNAYPVACVMVAIFACTVIYAGRKVVK